MPSADRHRQGGSFPAFLKISPTTACRPSSIPMSGGKPVSVFESGAILQYLGRKYGRFYPRRSAPGFRSRMLFWQVGGLGPMAGRPIIPQLPRRPALCQTALYR